MESWKAVKGYEGLYEVSDLGRVRSLPRATTHGKILKPYESSKNGYMTVSLSKGNKRTTKRVHGLVMNAFCPTDKKPGYDKDCTIDHKDGDKTNNALSNLEWCTQSENQKRAYRLGINGKTERKVIDLDSEEVFCSVIEASKSVGGRRASSIVKVCSGERSQYRDHHFAYYDDYINGTIPMFTGRYKKRSARGLWKR